MRLRRLAGTAALTLTLSLPLVACGSSSPTGAAATQVSGIQHYDVDAFATLTGAASTVVVDVRTPAEFASGHLAHAVNLDIRAADFAAKLATLDKNATYAVYCHSGNRSGQALQAMESAGFTHAADLTGGITAWTGAGKPVTTA